jgi:hypothetical protein
MPNIQGPNGKVISFPAGTSDADIAAVFSSMSSDPDTATPAGLPAGQTLPGFNAHPAVTMTPSILGRGTGPKGTVANLLTGAVKSIPGTLAGIAKLAPGTSDAWEPAEEAAQTNGTAQAIGKGIGNAAQFLIPGGAEEKLGAMAAEKLPSIAPLARIGAQALGAGSVNKAQGGSFAAGAAAGAVGGAIGEGFKKVAPLLAETALGVRATDRAYGRTPGQAIMEETTGIRPGTIAQQATDKVDGLSSVLEQAAANSPYKASLLPARQAADSAFNTALLRNNPNTLRKIGQLQDQLNNWSSVPGAGNAASIPQDVAPSTLLQLKRGVGDLHGSWNPVETPKFVGGAIGNVYHGLDSELDRTIPESAGLNQRISSLLPVAQRAGATDLNAGVTQRVVNRLARPTGALAGAGIGGGFGYKEGGVPGAVAGAGFGLVAPEVLANPTTLMAGARALNSPAFQKVIPLANAAVLNAARKNK